MMKSAKKRIKITCSCAIMVLLFCSACGNAEMPFTAAEEKQGSSQAGDEAMGEETPGDGTPGDEAPGDGTPGDETSGDEAMGEETPGDGTSGDEVPGNQNTDAALRNKLTYSNLDSESSMDEVRDILTKAGIQADYVDAVLSWATDYNDSMRECPSFSLVGDFMTIDGMTVDYGDYPAMSTQWYKRNNRNYHDVVCRIVAYELSQDNISIGNVIKEEDFDCWDENTAWLYTDGDILFGREAVEGEHKAYVPFPLIDWSKDMQAEYFTLFDPIGITEQCSEQEMFQAILEKWNGQEISFKESAFSLITFWTQSGDRICASHAAVLIEMDNGYLLFEKTNPESPYAATKFSSTDEVKQYLYRMMELDYARYDDQVGTYVILRNDRLL
nr:DUF4300 family protein [uncultured Acetatifactor sp.]